MNPSLLEKETKFLHALGDNEHYPHGQGSTINRALGLAVFDGDSDTLQCQSDKAKLHRLRKLFGGCKILIVDEVSIVGCRMLWDIHSWFSEIVQCQDKPFGGMCVVLMGDFVQSTPVG